MSTDKKIDYILRTVEERDVRYLRLCFTDVLGGLKALSISPEELEEAFVEGIGFDGSNVDGFASQEQSDLLAFPDADTFQILPWKTDDGVVANVFCDIQTPRREAFTGDPRLVLRNAFIKAEDLGYVANVGPKLEYFYFVSGSEPKPIDQAGYLDLNSADLSHSLRYSTSRALENLSIPVQYSFHAAGPAQNGVELRYAEALTCADNIVTARLVIRHIATLHGVFASFMPKPLQGVPGSAMLLNQSLLDHDGESLFWAPKTESEAHLSELAQQYIAGLIKYAPEYMLITNPTVNSYKRFDRDAIPAYATWGRKNRSAMVRIPTHKPGKHVATRAELRIPDPTANPYLANAVTLMAGLKGIEEGLSLPEEFVGGNPADYGEKLPINLGEALERFKQSELLKDVLGEHIFTYLCERKAEEWREFCLTVTDWETQKYYAGC